VSVCDRLAERLGVSDVLGEPDDDCEAVAVCERVFDADALSEGVGR